MRKAIQSLPTGERGYTLIELLVVLAVMALLIAATPAIVSAARPGAEARAATYALADTLRAARNAAVIADAERVVRLDVERKTYVGFDGKTRQLPGSIAWEVQSVLSQRSGDEVQFRFFPDGSSSGGRIRVFGAGRDYVIVDHGLTGRISNDE